MSEPYLDNTLDGLQWLRWYSSMLERNVGQAILLRCVIIFVFEILVHTSYYPSRINIWSLSVQSILSEIVVRGKAHSFIFYSSSTCSNYLNHAVASSKRSLEADYKEILIDDNLHLDSDLRFLVLDRLRIKVCSPWMGGYVYLVLFGVRFSTSYSKRLVFHRIHFEILVHMFMKCPKFRI